MDFLNNLQKAEERNTELEQKHSSEISALQLTLLQAQKKLQEQTEEIVRLNSADLIFKENERLKQEAETAKATMSLYEKDYQKRLEELQKAQTSVASQRSELSRLKADEKELIEEKAEELANRKTVLIKREYETDIERMENKHMADTAGLRGWLKVISSYAVSMTVLIGGIYASEVLNQTSGSIISATIIIHMINLFLRYYVFGDQK